jgi:transcriptional regulator with XRE-family HTH domain
VNFAESLKFYLRELKLSQANAAVVLGISARALWKWLHGQPPAAITQEGALARLEACVKAQKGPKVYSERLPDHVYNDNGEVIGYMAPPDKIKGPI